MGKMKTIAMCLERHDCFYCHKRIRKIGDERKNGKAHDYKPEFDKRWFHAACQKRAEENERLEEIARRYGYPNT